MDASTCLAIKVDLRSHKRAKQKPHVPLGSVNLTLVNVLKGHTSPYNNPIEYCIPLFSESPNMPPLDVLGLGPTVPNETYQAPQEQLSLIVRLYIPQTFPRVFRNSISASNQPQTATQHAAQPTVTRTVYFPNLESCLLIEVYQGRIPGCILRIFRICDTTMGIRKPP